MSSIAQINGLPPISDIIKRYKLAPQKSLGQNFLRDQYITDKIIASIPSIKNKTVVEVGPGPGGLTRSILFANPQKLVAIEYDKRCVEALKELNLFFPDSLEVIEQDALNYNYAQLGDVHVIANLPYNIGTELVTRWLLRFDNIKSITVMLQKEVVDRIIATPGSKDFGRLAVICGLRAEATKLFDVEPEFFYPPPKVISSVVHLALKPKPEGLNFDKLESFMKTLFTKRRKMLRTIFQNLNFQDLGIDETLRPEQLNIEQIVNLSQNFNQK